MDRLTHHPTNHPIITIHHHKHEIPHQQSQHFPETKEGKRMLLPNEQQTNRNRTSLSFLPRNSRQRQPMKHARETRWNHRGGNKNRRHFRHHLRHHHGRGRNAQKENCRHSIENETPGKEGKQEETADQNETPRFRSNHWHKTHNGQKEGVFPRTCDQRVAGETPEIACQKKEGKRCDRGSGLEHNRN